MTPENELHVYTLLKILQGQMMEVCASEQAFREILSDLEAVLPPDVWDIISQHPNRRDRILKDFLLKIGDGDPSLSEEFGSMWPKVEPSKPDDP